MKKKLISIEAKFSTRVRPTSFLLRKYLVMTVAASLTVTWLYHVENFSLESVVNSGSLAKAYVLYHIGSRVDDHLVCEKVFMPLIGLILKLRSLFSRDDRGINDKQRLRECQLISAISAIYSCI